MTQVFRSLLPPLLHPAATSQRMSSSTAMILLWRVEPV